MRNLGLKNLEIKKFKGINDCEVFCVNCHTLYAYDKGIIIKCNDDKKEIICNLPNNLYPAGHISKAIDLVYHYENDLLYLILTNGDLISVCPNNSLESTIVGSIENGIKFAQWSPDQEVIALVNGEYQIIVLTKDFDIVNEVSLHCRDLGEKPFVSVGWGRKETQFQGSAGKYVPKEISDTVQLAQVDDIKISWRGDAKYFVVSSINPQTQLRYLRIFSKNGILQYTSEALTGVEECLAWRPSGNLIASTQKLLHKYNVCFFEKNSLKHGEFPLLLNLEKSKVIEISWSKDSKILSVFIVDSFNDEENHENIVGDKYILFYITNNYKWYCKYKINFNALDQPKCMKWDLEKPNVFHIVSKKDSSVYHYKYTWIWVINKSKTSESDSESFVAVIDGLNVHLTSFKQGILPPPLCHYTITVTSVVNSVSFASDSSNDLLLHLSNGDVLIYKFLNSGSISHEYVGTMNLITNNSEIYYNCQWIETNKFIMSMIKFNEELISHFFILIDVDNLKSLHIVEKNQVELKSGMAFVKATNNEVIVYDNCGIFYLLKNNICSLLDFQEIKNVLEIDILKKGDNLLIFSLDNLNKFYVNSKLLFNNVLSFHMHDKFILLTNLKHELLCLNSDDNLFNIESLDEIFKRKIETGSRLVTSVQKDMKVILQMPRGNLECIQPRALSLYTVGKYLDSLQFDQAFNLMRKQRINLNLIFDHNQSSFLHNVNIFIEQIKNPQWISLFISDVIEEDVTKTLYAVAYKTKKHDSTLLLEEKNSKIDIVCDIMESNLKNLKNSDEFTLPILTCHIKRNKIEFLEKALCTLKNLKLREIQGEKPFVSFKQAFKYMLYLIDVEEIYNIALGMYDFDLALLIAKNSQKDPKEYVPFLNDLKKLEPHYQKFMIDKYLKRYHKALTSLILCDGDDRFNECLNFIKTHQLYRKALKLVLPETERYKKICLYYGEDLVKSNKFEEAGIMFFNAGMYQHAMKAYRKSGNWHEILNCAKELKLEGKELNQLYSEIAKGLTESKEFATASTIYLDYLKDVEDGIKTLADGKLFAEAYRISYLYNKSDLISQIIVPAILQHAHLMGLQITEFRNLFLKQKNRLQVVRKKKFEEADKKEETDIDSDVYSVASTIITQSHATSKGTYRTYRSAKNRRKQERKLLSLKEGSPYEDLALVISLHNLITRCLALMPEIKETNKFLIKINEFEMAENLQKNYDDLLEKIKNSKSEIWIPELLSNKSQIFGPNFTSNEIATTYEKTNIYSQPLLEPKYAIPPETDNKLNWKLEIVKS